VGIKFVWLRVSTTIARLVVTDRNTCSRATSAWVKYLWGWDDYWKAKETHITKVLIKSQQNWLRQKAEQFAMRSINLSFLFGMRRNCLMSESSWPLYLATGMAITQTVVFIESCHFARYIQNVNQHPAVKVNSVCRGNYWGSLRWIWTQEDNCWSYIVHLSNTWHKMGIQRFNFRPVMEPEVSVSSSVLHVLSQMNPIHTFPVLSAHEHHRFPRGHSLSGSPPQSVRIS